VRDEVKEAAARDRGDANYNLCTHIVFFVLGYKLTSGLMVV